MGSLSLVQAFSKPLNPNVSVDLDPHCKIMDQSSNQWIMVEITSWLLKIHPFLFKMKSRVSAGEG